MSSISASNPSSINPGIDKIVREYLESKGYKNAALALDADMNKTLDGATPGTAVDLVGNGVASSSSTSTVNGIASVNVVEAIYLKGLKDNDFSIYCAEFNNFSSWVLESFHSVKVYYLAVMFAAFCHCYVNMIRNSALEEAEKLFSTYQEFFHHSFRGEMQRLCLLQSPAQLHDQEFLANNTFIRSLLNAKFTVHITPLALQLLSGKLRSDNLVLLAAIVNQKIQFNRIEPVDEGEESNLKESCDFITLGGYNPDYTNNIKEPTKLKLGVAGTGELYRYWKERSALFTEVEYPELHDDPLLKAWSEHIIRPKAVLRKLARSDGSIPSTYDQHSLGNLLLKADQAFTKLQNRSSADTTSEDAATSANATATSAKLPATGDSLNPSVVCSTISNTYDSLVCLDITPNVTQISSGYLDGIVRVWRLDQTTEEYQKLPWFGRNLPAPYTWEFDQVLPLPRSTDGNSSSSHSSNGFGRNSRSSSSMKAPLSSYPCVEFIGHAMPVYSVAQSACERLVLSSSADETIRLWDTSVVQCVGRYHAFSTPWTVSFSPMDYYFAAGNADRSVTIYSTNREVPIRMMTGHTSDVSAVAWHGNGTLLASGSDDRSARLWDIRSAECARVFRHCSAPITSLQISPIGNILAAGTEHGKIYMWDIRSSRPLAVLQGHTNSVTAVSFSKDKSHALCSGSLDCSVRVWDVSAALETVYTPPIGGGAAEDQSVCVLKARHAFFTKACPIYKVGYTDKGMIYSGGTFSSSVASVLRDKNTADSANAVAEQMLVRSFGMSSVVPTQTSTTAGI